MIAVDYTRSEKGLLAAAALLGCLDCLGSSLSCSSPVANFDTIRFIGDVKHPLLDLSVDFLGRVDESVLDVVGSPG